MEENSQKTPALSIPAILQEAWSLVKGSKGPIWAISIWVLILSSIINWFLAPSPDNPIALPAYSQYLIAPLIKNLVTAPFFGGAVMVAITRARLQPVTLKSGYGYFHRAIPVIITLLIITFAAHIFTYFARLTTLMLWFSLHTGFLNALTAIITILVYTFTFLAIPLCMDKKQTPWEAIKNSCKIVKSHWIKILLLIIIIYIIFFITFLPFFVSVMIHPYTIYTWLGPVISIILLVWALPYFMLIQGVVYHQLMDTPAPTNTPSEIQ